MDKDAKIAELEKRVQALEHPTSFSDEFVQALVQHGFLQSTLELLFTSGANVDFVNLLVNAPNGRSTKTDATVQPQTQYVLQALPGGYFKPFSVDPTTDVVTSQGHGLSDGVQVWVMSTGVLPTGLSGAVPMYINNATVDTFKFNNPFGTPTDLTDAGEGIHYWQFYT